jgi:hypothetical protein
MTRRWTWFIFFFSCVAGVIELWLRTTAVCLSTLIEIPFSVESVPRGIDLRSEKLSAELLKPKGSLFP